MVVASRRIGVALVAVLAIAVALRAGTLAWSPLPATLDGFRYAALARDVVATGQLPVASIDADELVFTSLLAVASALVGERPLLVAQPLAACIGGASVLGAIAVAGRFVPTGWRPRDRRAIVLVVGLVLAADGLYLRRSGVPDEEVVAFLLFPLLALTVHRVFVTGRRRWVVTAGVVAIVFPPLHNFSSAITALTLTALAASHVVREPSRRTIGLASVVTVGAWVYFFGFFVVARRLGLRLTYSGLITDHLGAFAAWIVLAAVLAAWLDTTTPRVRRLVAGGALLPLFAITALNTLVPLFPGTIRTPPIVLALIVPFVVPVTAFAWGSGRLSGRAGQLVLALFVGPMTMVWYTLTTSLTPEFWGALMRAQTFVHPAVVAVAGVVAVGLASERATGRAGRALVVLLVVAAVVSLPLGYIHLDTGTGPRTVHESEFAASAFATRHTTHFASDHRLARAGPLYHEQGATASLSPVRRWLSGGPATACPTLAQQSWVTEGAHFFPTPPATIDAARLDHWRARNDLVYSVGGRTSTYLVRPPDEGAARC